MFQVDIRDTLLQQFIATVTYQRIYYNTTAPPLLWTVKFLISSLPNILSCLP